MNKKFFVLLFTFLLSCGSAVFAADIFYNGNGGGVSNNPPNPTVFTLTEPTYIAEISNYHWNGGSGIYNLTIGLQDATGTIYGPWTAYGWGHHAEGYSDWSVYPETTFPAGTYTVVDGDPATWAHDSASDYCGFTRVSNPVYYDARGVDTDADGIYDSADNCVNVANSNQTDADGDKVGDVCDNCPNLANPDQADADGDGIGNVCEINQCTNSLIDEVPSGSLSNWIVTNTGGNPIFSYNEIVSPFDGGTAIQTSVVGNTVSQCPSQMIHKSYDISGNTSNTKLKAYLAFTSSMDTYNFPYIVVYLYDNQDNALGYQVYYGKGVISGLYVEYAAADPAHYTELSSASGDVVLDLSRIGADINFSKVTIYISNYACIGENSVTFDHLRVVCGESDEECTDTTNPVITILGDNPATVYQGDEYHDAGATAMDDHDGDITASIEVKNMVNTSVIGTYLVTYDVMDAKGNEANQMARTVNVVAKPAPAVSGGGGPGMSWGQLDPSRRVKPAVLGASTSTKPTVLGAITSKSELIKKLIELLQQLLLKLKIK